MNLSITVITIVCCFEDKISPFFKEMFETSILLHKSGWVDIVFDVFGDFGLPTGCEQVKKHFLLVGL